MYHRVIATNLSRDSKTALRAQEKMFGEEERTGGNLGSFINATGDHVKYVLLQIICI